MKRSRAPHTAEGGYILLFVLVALLAAAALVPLFARALFERTRTTLKTERQDLAAAELEARYADFREELRRALATGAPFSFQSQRPGALQAAFRTSSNSLFTLEAAWQGNGVEGLANRPPLGQERPLTAYAGMPDEEEGLGDMRDDPFYGVPAEVIPATLVATLTPRLAPASASDPSVLEGRLRLVFRAIPLSVFSLGSWGQLRLGTWNASAAGRVHARGVVTVTSPDVLVPWKLTAGGLRVGDEASLHAHCLPDDPRLTLNAGSSSEGETWLALRGTWREGALPVCTNREAPVGLLLPLPLATLLAPRDPELPEPPPGSPELLKFEHHASLVVTERPGREPGLSGPLAEVGGTCVQMYDTSRNPGGPRIIRVNVGQFLSACAEARQPGRLVVRSSTAGTIVLLANAEDLSAPFSVATPQPVYVAGNFNATGQAASIVTGQRITAVIAAY